MKICKKIDSCGRVVIPVEFRTHIGVKLGDMVQFETKEGQLVVTNGNLQTCALCGRPLRDLVKFKDIYVCSDCLQEIKSI